MLEVTIAKAVPLPLPLLVTVTPVLACTKLCAALVAVTVIDVTLELTGTINRPEEEMLPALLDQLTAVLLVLVMAATN
jgi:hypothetical protein